MVIASRGFASGAGAVAAPTGAAAETAPTVDRVIAAAHTPTIHARHGIQMVSTRGPPFLEPARSIPQSDVPPRSAVTRPGFRKGRSAGVRSRVIEAGADAREGVVDEGDDVAAVLQPGFDRRAQRCDGGGSHQP